MNEKLIWFGRYLECEMIYVSKKGIPDLEIKEKVTPLALDLICLDDIKLILKELSDITPGDAKEIWVKAFNENPEYHENYYHERFMSVIEGNSSLIAVIDKLKSSVTIVDDFRSKGYAIGIPKEYYITPKELEEMK